MLVFITALCASIFTFLFYRMARAVTSVSEYSVAISLLLLDIYLLAELIISLEISDFYPNAEYFLPVVWAVGGLLAGWGSFALNNTSLRFAVYITFLITGMRLLSEEASANLTTYIPVSNSRVFAYCMVVLCAGALLYLLYAKRERISAFEFRFASTFFFFGMHALLFSLLTLEVSDFFERRRVIESGVWNNPKALKSLHNRQNAALSVACFMRL